MATENFSPLGEDLIEFFKSRLEEFTFAVKIDFYFQAATNLKQVVKITKIPDHFAVILEKDLLVQINTAFYDSFINKEDMLNILFDREIDKIQIVASSGKIKISTPNFNANMGFIEKYSYEEVQRAVEAETLCLSQQKDKETDLESVDTPAPKKGSRKRK